MSYNKILIAVDSSTFSNNAAKKGMELVRQLSAKAAIVFVLDTTKALGNIDAGIFPEDALVILKAEAEQTLEELVSRSDDRSLPRFTPEGHPAEKILETAITWQADLIVMGAHGKTGLLHRLFGSVTEHVIRHSITPVMIIPSK